MFCKKVGYEKENKLPTFRLCLDTSHSPYPISINCSNLRFTNQVKNRSSPFKDLLKNKT